MESLCLRTTLHYWFSCSINYDVIRFSISGATRFHPIRGQTAKRIIVHNTGKMTACESGFRGHRSDNHVNAAPMTAAVTAGYIIIVVRDARISSSPSHLPINKSAAVLRVHYYLRACTSGRRLCRLHRHRIRTHAPSRFRPTPKSRVLVQCLRRTR